MTDLKFVPLKDAYKPAATQATASQLEAHRNAVLAKIKKAPISIQQEMIEIYGKKFNINNIHLYTAYDSYLVIRSFAGSGLALRPNYRCACYLCCQYFKLSQIGSTRGIPRCEIECPGCGMSEAFFQVLDDFRISRRDLYYINRYWFGERDPHAFRDKIL